MKIWAHRGCSLRYPENTILSFENAMKIKGLTGIELDIQLTSDGHIVVCHDERVDRTTDGIGEIKNFTLSELKKLNIDAGDCNYEHIPTIEEVFELLKPKLRNGMKLNIKLKNSNFMYEGMEEKIVELVHKYNFQDSVIYSSFNSESIRKIKEIDSNAETGILGNLVSDCLFMLKGGCMADALHPFWRGMNIPKGRFNDYPVRAWFAGYLYPEKPTGNKLDLLKLESQGITDVFLNEPEVYLK